MHCKRCNTHKLNNAFNLTICSLLTNLNSMQPSSIWQLTAKVFSNNSSFKPLTLQKTSLQSECYTSPWLSQHQLACFCAAERFLWWAEVNKEMEMRSSALIQPGCRSHSNPPKSSLAWGMQRGNPAPWDLIRQSARTYTCTHRHMSGEKNKKETERKERRDKAPAGWKCKTRVTHPDNNV